MAQTEHRLTFSIRDNVIEGNGPTAIGNQNGIYISQGATGTVQGNRFTHLNHGITLIGEDRDYATALGQAVNPTVLPAAQALGTVAQKTLTKQAERLFLQESAMRQARH